MGRTRTNRRTLARFLSKRGSPSSFVEPWWEVRRAERRPVEVVMGPRWNMGGLVPWPPVGEMRYPPKEYMQLELWRAQVRYQVGEVRKQWVDIAGADGGVAENRQEGEQEQVDTTKPTPYQGVGSG